MADDEEEEDLSDESDPSDPSDPSDEYEPTPDEQEALEQERLESERRYVNLTRSLSVSLLFILPLLLIYELGVLIGGAELNAAAELMKRPISWLQSHPTKVLGADAMLLLNGLVIVVALVAVWRASRRNALRLSPYLWMLTESGVYALLLGPLALAPITGQFQLSGLTPNGASFLDALVVGAGAGLYEEAFFRLMILGTVYFLAKELGNMRAFGAGMVALFISGALFSAAHFMVGESPDLGAFIYRLSAGMILGLIFLTRGFGIAVWTHALFDVYVMTLTPR